MTRASAAVTAATQAVARGDVRTASALAAEALAAGDVHPVLLRLRASGHVQEGRFEAAAEDFRASLALEPDDAGVLSALGLCLGRAGRLQEAAVALDHAVRLQPQLAAAHFRRGWIAEGMGEPRAARDAYARAARDPAQTEAPGALALLAARQGDWEAVRRWVQAPTRGAAQAPTMQLALAALSLEEGRPEQAEAVLRHLLAAPAAADAVIASTARRQLGDVLDARGYPEEACRAWREGAAELRRAVSPRFGAGGGERSVVLAERLVAAFEVECPQVWRRPPTSEAARGAAKGHLFLVGFPRSGTTLMNQVLANCPDAAVLDERELLADAAAHFLRDDAGLARLAAANADELDRFRELYWRRVSEAGADVRGRVFIDKLPLNLLGLPLVCRLFPDARVLFMLRDPRDVIVSCLQQRFAVNSGTFELLDLEDAARFYDACMRLTQAYGRVLDMDVRRQSYEALVDAFDPQTREICDFAGLSWTPATRAFEGRSATGEVATPSAAQLTRGLNRASIARWRRHAGCLAPVLPILVPWAQRFGYEDS